MTNQLPHQQRRAVDMRIPAIEKYAYCLCLHVKPTTIFIAVFKLIRALLFASILLNSEFAISEQVNDLGLPLDDRHRSTVIVVNLVSRIIMASVSAVGIYAVISGRAALLMPLYAILLVDFFFALPSFYNREFDPTLADNMADFRSTSPSSQYTRYSIMLFSTITMIVKIYFLCVIWKCYRYLRLIELVSPIRLAEIYPNLHRNGSQYPTIRVLGSGDSTDLSTGHNMIPPPYESIASNMKPPNYEEAMKSTSVNFTANPTYSQQQTVVFTNLPTEQHQNVSTQVINPNDPLVRPSPPAVVVVSGGMIGSNSNNSISSGGVSSASTMAPEAANSLINQPDNAKPSTVVTSLPQPPPPPPFTQVPVMEHSNSKNNDPPSRNNDLQQNNIVGLSDPDIPRLENDNNTSSARDTH